MNTMSAVDLGGDDEFYDLEEEDYWKPFYESEDGGDSREERHSSGDDEEPRRRGTQPKDYSLLELAQRHRNRPRATHRRERNGGGPELQSCRLLSNAQDVQSSQLRG